MARHTIEAVTQLDRANLEKVICRVVECSGLEVVWVDATKVMAREPQVCWKDTAAVTVNVSCFAHRNQATRIEVMVQSEELSLRPDTRARQVFQRLCGTLEETPRLSMLAAA